MTTFSGVLLGRFCRKHSLKQKFVQWWFSGIVLGNKRNKGEARRMGWKKTIES